MFKYLVNNYEYKYIDSEDLIKNKGNLKEYFMNKYGELPEYIISYADFKSLCVIYNELDKYCSTVVLLCDIHHGKSIQKYRKPVLLKSKYILNNYGYMYEKYYPKHNGNIFFPHSLSYKLDYNHEPIKKILVSGHLNEAIYPNRHIMYNKSKTRDCIYYHKPDYTGYRITEKDREKTFGENYYKLLNQYICSFTDDANKDRPYIVGKFFEIMGNGSLLLACNERTKDEFSNLGFIDGIHYISCNMENIDEKIDFILNDKNIKIINEIRFNGYTLVQNNHTYVQRASEIYNLLSNNVKLDNYMTKYNTSYKMIGHQ